MEESHDNSPLSRREKELLELVARGATNQQIARELFISVNTVKVHLRNIFDKLGVESRTEAAMLAVREGWITIEGAPAGETAAPQAPARGVAPISLWQRIFLVASLLLAFGVVFLLPSAGGSLRGGASADPFTERTLASPLLPASQESTRWSALPAMPQARGRMAAVWHEGKIYVIGGDSNAGVVGAMDVYDSARGEWSALGYKPTPASNIAAAVLDQKIWVPGGFLEQGQFSSTLEVYDLETGEWREGPALPAPLCAYALAAYDGDLYLFGGANDGGYLNSVYRLDLERDAWDALTPMPTRRAFAAAAVVGERIYVLGGYDGERELTTCEAYAPAAEARGDPPWEGCPPLTLPRGGLGLAAVGSTLYAVGGGWQNYLAYNERWDTENGGWTRFDTPVSGEWRNLGLASDGKSLYALGGWSGGFLDAMWAYQAIVTIFLPITP